MHLPVWLKGDAEITYDAGRYFLTFAWMLPFTQMSSLTSSFLQCAGDMLTPSILNAVMCVLDVIFNTLLIPKHGVFGAGLGTMLACAVVSLLMLYFCCARNGQLCLRREEQRFDASILRTALRIGTPVALQEVAMCGAQVVSTAIIAPLGAVSVAANAFAVTAESICYMPGYGIANAAAALVGRSVGAGDMDQVKYYMKKMFIISYIANAAMVLLIMFSAHWLVRLYDYPDEACSSLPRACFASNFWQSLCSGFRLWRRARCAVRAIRSCRAF